MIRITFLGTAASRPTVGRNVSGIAIQREGDLFLFDCGEGTQRQMMRFATGFGVHSIFVTHFHADHFLGIIGLVRTMALQGREEPLYLYGPRGAEQILRDATLLGVNRIRFPVKIREMEAERTVVMKGYEVVAFPVRHGTPAVGYALVEEERLGRFDVERARALGVPEGPLFGRLHRGEAVEVDGRTVQPEEVVGEPRPGRKVVYTGDTTPGPETLEMARGADLLIHEATFLEEEADRAKETFHSTARSVGRLAREAEVGRLILTHVSARYSENPAPLVEEARSEFPETVAARDGMVLELGYTSHEERKMTREETEVDVG